MQRDPSSLQPTAGFLMSLKSGSRHICRAGSVNTRGWFWVSDHWLVFIEVSEGTSSQEAAGASSPYSHFYHILLRQLLLHSSICSNATDPEGIGSKHLLPLSFVSHPPLKNSPP